MSTTNWIDALSTEDLPTDDVIGVVIAGARHRPLYRR